MGLYIMKGSLQIVILIGVALNVQKPKYLVPREVFNSCLYISLCTLFRLCMLLWLN